MAQLTVRNLDPALIKALKQRAAAHGWSAEAEHRAILRHVLAPAARMPLKDFLLTMPDTGDDADFGRIPGDVRDVEI